jgi:activating signal cointegrator 1
MARAITICQPYAQLILDGAKRVENRTWRTTYRGELYIHAGKSRDWLDIAFNGTTNIDAATRYPIDALQFGALVGVCNLVECVPIDGVRDGVYSKQFPWLKAHEHAHGPWCWVLEDVHTITPPRPIGGRQGLWMFEP